MKKWFLYQILSLTFNKSWSLSWVQQTLFLDQDLIQLLSVSYSGLKFECSVVLTLKFFCPRSVAVWWQVCDILSSKFTWQLKWAPYYELKYTLCWKQQNKSHHFWSTFGLSKVIARTTKSFLNSALNWIQFLVSYTLIWRLYLCSHAKPAQDPLNKVVDLA